MIENKKGGMGLEPTNKRVAAARLLLAAIDLLILATWPPSLGSITNNERILTTNTAYHHFINGRKEWYLNVSFVLKNPITYQNNLNEIWLFPYFVS